MSKVIKNNDGVAVVEGTPAASLVKDVNRIFETKPPKRMAGDNIAQPIKFPKTEEKLVSRDISIARDPALKDQEQEQEQEPESQEMRATNFTNMEEKTPEEKETKREKAVEKTKEFKRQRFAERSGEEQESTQGKFITTLGR